MFTFAFAPENAYPTFKTFNASNRDEALMHFDTLLMEAVRSLADHVPTTARLLNEHLHSVHCVHLSRCGNQFCTVRELGGVEWHNI